MKKVTVTTMDGRKFTAIAADLRVKTDNVGNLIGVTADNGYGAVESPSCINFVKPGEVLAIQSEPAKSTVEEEQ